MEGNADQQRNLTSSAFTLQPKPFLGSLVLFFGQSFDFLISTQVTRANSCYGIQNLRLPKYVTHTVRYKKTAGVCSFTSEANTWLASARSWVHSSAPKGWQGWGRKRGKLQKGHSYLYIIHTCSQIKFSVVTVAKYFKINLGRVAWVLGFMASR